jgi:ComF family protein
VHPKCRGRYTIDGLVSFFRYDNAVRKAVKLIKYKFVTDLISEFTDLIPQTSYNFISDNILSLNTIIIPIPLHPKRYRERGFNQAELIVCRMSSKLNIPVSTGILTRVKYTEPQVKMKSRSDRLKNMDDVFSVNTNAKKQLNNVTVILVDDVFTTGATMRSAAKVLKKAGISSVWAITMAR